MSTKSNMADKMGSGRKYPNPFGRAARQMYFEKNPKKDTRLHLKATAPHSSNDQTTIRSKNSLRREELKARIAKLKK